MLIVLDHPAVTVQYLVVLLWVAAVEQVITVPTVVQGVVEAVQELVPAMVRLQAQPVKGLLEEPQQVILTRPQAAVEQLVWAEMPLV
jgi:hypothetical protein